GTAAARPAPRTAPPTRPRRRPPARSGAPPPWSAARSPSAGRAPRSPAHRPPYRVPQPPGYAARTAAQAPPGRSSAQPLPRVDDRFEQFEHAGRVLVGEDRHDGDQPAERELLLERGDRRGHAVRVVRGVEQDGRRRPYPFQPTR